MECLVENFRWDCLALSGFSVRLSLLHQMVHESQSKALGVAYVGLSENSAVVTVHSLQTEMFAILTPAIVEYSSVVMTVVMSTGALENARSHLLGTDVRLGSHENQSEENLIC